MCCSKTEVLDEDENSGTKRSDFNLLQELTHLYKVFSRVEVQKLKLPSNWVTFEALFALVHSRSFYITAVGISELHKVRRHPAADPLHLDCRLLLARSGRCKPNPSSLSRLSLIRWPEALISEKLSTILCSYTFK